MATIKSFTDLSQSKKLAEILPIESADMLWEQHGAEPYVTIKPWTTIGKSIGCHCLSCWSLAALLDFLKDKIIFGGNSPEGWFCCYTIKNPTKTLTIYEDSLVDVCVETILMLNELKML